MYSNVLEESISIRVRFSPVSFRRHFRTTVSRSRGIRGLERHFPMLLHAFQLGLADTTRDSNVVDEVKQEMRKLIVGVLAPGGSTTSINLADVADGYLGALSIAIRVTLGVYSGGLSELLCDWEVRERIGTPGKDSDLYAAAIALAYDLHETHPDPRRREFILDTVTDAIRTVDQGYAAALAVGQRSVPGAARTRPTPTTTGPEISRTQ